MSICGFYRDILYSLPSMHTLTERLVALRIGQINVNAHGQCQGSTYGYVVN
jgi:hypothetical protein